MVAAVEIPTSRKGREKWGTPALLDFGDLRGADAPLFHGMAQVRALACTIQIKIKIKIKVKGSGRGRPLYTGMSTKVDSTFVDFTFPHGRVRVE